MKFEIKHRYTGAVLFALETESMKLCVEAAVRYGANLSWSDLSGSDLSWSDLSGSDLSGSDLRGSNLRGSNLRGSNLRGSNLRGSNLRGSDLSGSDLSGSDLSGSDLRDAKGLDPRRTNPLLLFYAQPGPCRAYKLVTDKYVGPFNGGTVWAVGETLTFPDFNPDRAVECGAGGNIATLPWCLREFRDGYRILLVEFDNSPENLCIPDTSDGKFRVKTCRVVRELDSSEYTTKEAV